MNGWHDTRNLGMGAYAPGLCAPLVLSRVSGPNTNAFDYSDAWMPSCVGWKSCQA